MNRVTLIGLLGKDPEVKRLESGTPVAKFTLATDESYKDKNGEIQKQTEWHDIVAWRGQAELAERGLKKGTLAFVEGKITHRKYTDANGVDRYITEIVANTIRVLEKRPGGSGANFPTQEPPLRAAQTASVVNSTNGNGNTFDHIAEPPPATPSEDDLPF